MRLGLGRGIGRGEEERGKRKGEERRDKESKGEQKIAKESKRENTKYPPHTAAPHTETPERSGKRFPRRSI